MATNLGTAYVAVVPSMEGIQGNLVRQMVPAVGAAADQAGREGGRRLGGAMGSAMKNAMGVAAATMGVGALVGSLKAAVGQAANLEQSAGAVTAVFKNGAPQVANWARGAAKALGLSANDYNEAASILGAQLKNAGVGMDELAPKTDKLIHLGADMAAQFGGSTKDAVAALSSALRGERDPIERYGVSLSQSAVDAKAAELGFQKVGGALSQEANAAATTALILEQTRDLHGAFGREAGTYAGQVQRMGAAWDNTQAKIGALFIPMLIKVVEFFNGRIIPGLTEVAGGVRAFGAAFTASRQGLIDITSTGFAGWLEGVGNRAGTTYRVVSASLGPAFRMIGDIIRDMVLPILARLGGFLVQNQNGLKALAIVIGVGAVAWKTVTTAQAAYLAVTVGVPKVLAAARASMLALNAAMRANPIGIVITIIAALVAAVVIAYNRIGWFKDGVNAAWRLIANTTNWLYRNVWIPVWNGIRTYLAVVIAVIKTLLDGVVFLIRRVFAPIFTWLYNTIIRPIWDAITRRIRDFSNWFRNSLVPTVRGGIDVLSSVFRFLFNNVVRPIWDSISSKISSVWNFIRDRIFSPMSSWIRDRISPGFSAGVSAIERAWERVRGIVSRPVKFVIDTVINKGFIDNFNVVARKFGIGTIPTISTRGFHSGGIIPGQDPGRRDNMLVPMRSGEGVLTPEAVRLLGGASFVHRANAAAAGRAYAGPGTRVYGGPSSFYGLAGSVYATGRLNVSGGAPGYDMTGAINMLDKATRVKVQRGGGHPNVNVQSGFYPAWWAGYYENGGIRLNNAIAGGMSMASKRILLAHEIGHALGLPHSARMHGGNGAMSMMNYDNMYQHASVTPADVAALSAIYGGSGFASGGGSSPEDEKPGLIKRIIDGLMDKIGISSLIGKIPGGGFMLEIMKKAASAAFDGLKAWIPKALDKINPVDDILGKIKGLFGGNNAPGVKVFDGGGWLEQSAAPQLMWHRQEKPDAVLSNQQWQGIYAAARNNGGGSGIHVENINAFDMSDAMRQMTYEQAKREALHNVG